MPNHATNHTQTRCNQFKTRILHLFKNIESEIISRIKSAKNNLKIAVTWFTNQEIFNEILKKLENKEFKVDLIVLNDKINNKIEGLNFQKFIDLNGNFYFSNNDNMVHHKICLIDDSLVITGSYNWTYYAENRNWENVVLIQNEEIVNGYLNEFSKIIEAHSKVTNVNMVKQQDTINSNDYLRTDYSLQAVMENRKGNDLAVAKIYTELIRINNKKEEKQKILKARNEITKKYNTTSFEVSPFEIGISLIRGYKKVIPAFEKLPFTVVREGTTSEDYSDSIGITIQKHDFGKTETMIRLGLDNLKPQPKGTVKIKLTITLEKSGKLKIDCLELNGFERRKLKVIDIKNWLQHRI